MIRGTTPTLTFKTSVDLTGAKEIWVTFSRENIAGYEVLTRTKAQMEVTPSALSFSLTQEETLKLNPHNEPDKIVYIQCRALTAAGEAIATNIISEAVGHLLKEEVME